MVQIDYLLIGGGIASVSACKAIRQQDNASRIAILTDEAAYPVDRPPLSKQLLVNDSWTIEDAESVARSFYEDNGIDLFRDQRASVLDPVNRIVATFDGKAYSYGKLLLATGSRARGVEVPGIKLSGIYTLRSASDSIRLRETLQTHPELVIVGGGFIAVEAAAAALARGCVPTLIVRGSRLLQEVGSNRFSASIHEHLTKLGAKIVYNDEAVFFAGSKTLKSVHTRNGLEIPAGAALIAVGGVPNTEWLDKSELRLSIDGGVIVDHQMRTAIPTIWAAGDIASLNGKRVEHHLNAKWQGQHAGMTMAGSREMFDRVPYIYSDIGELHVNIRGQVDATDPALSLASKQDGLHIEVYADDIGGVSGVLSWSTSDPLLDRVTEAAELLIRKNMPAEGLCAEDFTDY